MQHLANDEEAHEWGTCRGSDVKAEHRRFNGRSAAIHTNGSGGILRGRSYIGPRDLPQDAFKTVLISKDEVPSTFNVLKIIKVLQHEVQALRPLKTRSDRKLEADECEANGVQRIIRNTSSSAVEALQSATCRGIFPTSLLVAHAVFDLIAIQTALREFGFDGWLLYDFRNSNVLARRVLDLGEQPVGSRRFFYWIPVQGEPKKLVHRIESGALDHLPGGKTVYLRWQELEAGVASLVRGTRRIAMEYSPRNANPYISKVDAGTVELVRSFGVEVAPSGDLIQLFEATWDDSQWAMHLEAAKHTDSAYARAWKFIANRIRKNHPVTELDVQHEIMAHFGEHKMVTYHPPIVGVGPHSGDPHYETGAAPIHEGDFLLIDLWAKLDHPRAVYSDLTRVGFIGKSVPAKYEEIFQIVAAGRDAAIARVEQAFAKGEPLQGWQVDQAGRDVIESAGYGHAFVHRIGHSIGQETHGNGANMDNLETHEERRVLPRTCFSVEPGIYLPEFGVRSEINVFVDAARKVHVTGGALQRTVHAVLAEF